MKEGLSRYLWASYIAHYQRITLAHALSYHCQREEPPAYFVGLAQLVEHAHNETLGRIVIRTNNQNQNAVT